MIIGGLQKLSLIDYPGKVVATIFLVGCNFRCPYCHNPELVSPSARSPRPELGAKAGQVYIKESETFKFLDERIGFLDGVCITGGEPTIHLDLPKFIQSIKKRGFLVKLDTNGSNSEMLENLIKDDLIDFIAMDIKTSILKYKKLKAGNKVSQIQESIDIIRNGGVDYEFRTTVVPKIVDDKDIKEIGKWLKGSKKFTLQQFRPGKTLDPSFENIKPYTVQDLQKMVKILEPYIEEVELRI